VPEFEFGSQRSKVKVIRDKNDKVWRFFVSGPRRGGGLLAMYVCENIFSIAGVAGVIVGHATTSVSKQVMQLCQQTVLRRWEN